MAITKIIKTLNDDDLIDWVVTRIEQADWDGNLDPLNDAEKDFIRSLRFQLMFGNGGFQYFFQMDQYGISTADSLDRIGHGEFANPIRELFQRFPPPENGEYSIDLDRLLDEKYFELESREQPLWPIFETLLPSIARIVRDSPDQFSHLESRTPYIPYQ